jgi:Fe-S-cluster containining protein
MFTSLRAFKQKVRHRKSSLRRFLTKLEKNPPEKLDQLTVMAEKEVWAETNCLACANCCKTMTPTYTHKDIRRISSHLGMTAAAFKEKWLHKERGTGDWLNRSTPCQFLNLKNNMCSIYEVRPVDCSGFPHLPKRKMIEYMHVHKQNVAFCPATFSMVEKLMEMVK